MFFDNQAVRTMKKTTLWLGFVSSLAMLLAFLIPLLYHLTYAGFLVNHFSKHRYIDDSMRAGYTRTAIALFIIFSGVAWLWNQQTLRKIGKFYPLPMALMSAADQFAVPISIWCMVIINNSKPYLTEISSLLHPVVLGVVLLIKHIVVVLIAGKKKRGLPQKQ
jgi:hypothetical protein